MKIPNPTQQSIPIKKHSTFAELSAIWKLDIDAFYKKVNPVTCPFMSNRQIPNYSADSNEPILILLPFPIP